MTLIGAPQVIFLDEPTTGLDPRSRRAVWKIVKGLVGDGTTVFLTTHYLEEADKLAGSRSSIGDGWSRGGAHTSSSNGFLAAASTLLRRRRRTYPPGAAADR